MPEVPDHLKDEKIEPVALEDIGTDQQKIREIVLLMVALTKVQDVLKAKVDEAKAQMQELKNQLLEEMDTLKLQNFRMADIGLVYVHVSPKIGLLKADKPEVYAWLKANGHGSIVKEEVNPRTFQAFCKSLKEEGLELPPKVTEFIVREPRIRSGKG